VVDRQLVEDIANRIRPGGEGLIEKDWHVVRAIGVLASLDHGEARPAFSGGTSLSIGWGLIKRVSEDVDFKVGMPAAENPSQARVQRRAYRIGKGFSTPSMPQASSWRESLSPERRAGSFPPTSLIRVHSLRRLVYGHTCESK